MPRIILAFVLVGALIATIQSSAIAQPKNAGDAIVVGPQDWPWWRGPNRNGVADPKQKVPLKWSETENVLWKAPIPGRGHGSPIVVDNQVFLAAADAKTETQSVLCYDRTDGTLLWQTEVHRGGYEKGGNKQSSMASATLACDGQRVFVNFLHNKAIYATALTRQGKQIWQTKITDYTLHQGFGSSPAVYESLVIVSADNKGGTGLIAALERTTGKFVWKHERPKWPNYASPIIHKIGGRDQLFFIGCKLVTSLEPLTGKKIWETEGSTEECVTSTVTDGKRIIISGGYPKGHTAAIHAVGPDAGKTAWENKVKVYVPSLIEHRGYLYGVQDTGFAMCWKFDSGEEMWKGRLAGNFTASPVLVGEHLFATNESGRTFIYKANPKAFELIAENQIGNEAMATPTICGGRIYMRVAVHQKGQRQEMLYCIGARD